MLKNLLMTVGMVFLMRLCSLQTTADRLRLLISHTLYRVRLHSPVIAHCLACLLRHRRRRIGRQRRITEYQTTVQQRKYIANVTYLHSVE